MRLVKRIENAGRLSKEDDVKSVIRLLRVSSSDFDQLGFVLNNKYYFDTCFPMRSSISCSRLEKFSSALHWFAAINGGNENILHYLDDFLFGGKTNTLTCKETQDSSE